MSKKATSARNAPAADAAVIAAGNGSAADAAAAAAATPATETAPAAPAAAPADAALNAMRAAFGHLNLTVRMAAGITAGYTVRDNDGALIAEVSLNADAAALADAAVEFGEFIDSESAQAARGMAGALTVSELAPELSALMMRARELDAARMVILKKSNRSERRANVRAAAPERAVKGPSVAFGIFKAQIYAGVSVLEAAAAAGYVYAGAVLDIPETLPVQLHLTEYSNKLRAERIRKEYAVLRFVAGEAGAYGWEVEYADKRAYDDACADSDKLSAVFHDKVTRRMADGKKLSGKEERYAARAMPGAYAAWRVATGN